MSDVYIDAHQLRDFGRQVRASSPELSRQFNRDLKKGAEITATAARAASSWSKQISPSIRVKGGASLLRVTADGGGSPIAALYENHGVPGSWRHPVFGNRENWVEQKARPYLWPSWLLTQNRVWDEILVGVEKALVAMGFR